MAENTVPVTFQIVGLPELREANKQLKSMSGTGGNVAKATKSTRNFGFAAQNAGYQVQDFIVQVQAGQDPMRALGQQLPQLTVGMGAWGAAIGVVAAGLPALISLMRDTDDAAGDLEESTAALNTSLSNIGRTFDTLDLSNYVEQYLAADEATRQLMESTLEYQKLIASLDLDEAIGNLIEIPQMAPGTGGRSGRGNFARRFDDAAEAAGLYEQQLKNLEPLISAVADEETRSLETVQQLNEALRQVALSGDIRNSNLRDTIENYRQVEQALRILETADAEFAEQVRTQTNAALLAQNGLLEELVVNLERVQNTYDANLGFDTGIFAAENAQIQDSIGLSAIEEFITPLEEDLPEAFDLAAASAQIFGDTMETALNGVAMGTQDLSDAVTNMVKVIVVELAKLAAYQGIASLFSGTSIGSAAASLLPSAKGNVFSGGDVVPFAKGGIVNSPVVFPMARGAGLMGEAGPEAILPLGRNSRGELGVKSEGMNVIVNNNAPGVAVNPRQTGDGLTIDVVMAQVSAAIDRGGNPIANSIERNYNVGRGRAAY